MMMPRSFVYCLLFAVILSKFDINRFWFTYPPMEGATLLSLIVYNITVVDEKDGDFTLRIRDSALSFNVFECNTDEVAAAINQEDDGEIDIDSALAQLEGADESEGFAADDGLSLLGIKIVKDTAKDFFYRRYAGFNTLVVKL